MTGGCREVVVFLRSSRLPPSFPPSADGGRAANESCTRSSATSAALEAFTYKVQQRRLGNRPARAWWWQAAARREPEERRAPRQRCLPPWLCTLTPGAGRPPSRGGATTDYDGNHPQGSYCRSAASPTPTAQARPPPRSGSARERAKAWATAPPAARRQVLCVSGADDGS